MFSTDDDVVVWWGFEDFIVDELGIRDHALRIDRPKKLDVPDEFHQILDVWIFMQTVCRLLATDST